MKRSHLSKTVAFSLSLLLLYSLPANAQQIFNLRLQQNQNPEQVIQQFSSADVVYLGESHSSLADHQAQLEIIQELHRLNPKIAIAMEMFQRPYQDVLDRYLAGEISEAQLIEQSEYETRWRFPWEYYAPIVRFAKNNQLPLLALNTPTNVTQKVARTGLESLTGEDWNYIPSRAEIDTNDPEYRQMMREIYDDIHQGQGQSDRFENFFLAQILWDETMADAIAQFLHTHPTYQVVVLAGQGHIIYGYGIPSRVSRRMSGNFRQYSILLNPSDEIKSSSEGLVADYFWQTMVSE